MSNSSSHIQPAFSINRHNILCNNTIALTTTTTELKGPRAFISNPPLHFCCYKSYSQSFFTHLGSLYQQCRFLDRREKIIETKNKKEGIIKKSLLSRYGNTKNLIWNFTSQVEKILLVTPLCSKLLNFDPPLVCVAISKFYPSVYVVTSNRWYDSSCQKGKEPH